MLVEIAIGDAYGAGFEFCDREKIARNNGVAGYVAHELGMAAGRYTDDTQMSIAVAEVLLSATEATSDAFADAFVRCYARDPRPGYSKRLQTTLATCRDGAELRLRVDPVSRRNGAAMRAVPAGLVADPELSAAVARAQAVVTHDTVEGVLSAQVVAAMAHCLLYDRAAVVDLPVLVARRSGFAPRIDWSAEVACDAIQTLHAVTTALVRNRSMSELLRDCVDFGGDVDSVAAIAMGLASLTEEYACDVPTPLVDGLERGPYGKGFLVQLDAALAERFPMLSERIGPGRLADD